MDANELDGHRHSLINKNRPVEIINKFFDSLDSNRALEAKVGFDTTHPRNEDGQLTSTCDWHKIDIKEQTEIHKKENGTTITLDGKNMAYAKGMASVCTFPERSWILDSELTEKILNDYINTNKKLLSSPGNKYAVGTWYGWQLKQLRLYIVTITDLKSAKKLGKQHNQIAIFDLENMVEIPIGRTGMAKSDVFIMKSKGKKTNRFDGYGAILQRNHPNAKPMSFDEYLERIKKLDEEIIGKEDEKIRKGWENWGKYMAKIHAKPVDNKPTEGEEKK